MDIHCANNWIFHQWGPDGKCIRRCGASLNDDRGSPHASTLDDDLSPVEERVLVLPVDLAFPRGSHLRRR